MKQSRQQTRENNDFFFLFSFFLFFSDLDGAFGVYRLAQEQRQPDLVGPETRPRWFSRTCCGGGRGCR